MNRLEFFSLFVKWRLKVFLMTSLFSVWLCNFRTVDVILVIIGGNSLNLIRVLYDDINESCFINTETTSEFNYIY